MLRIEANQIPGATVRPAPFGIEGDSIPRLVWDDPNPNATIKQCQVIRDGNLLTADTIEGLQEAAERVGLVCNGDAYTP